MKKYIIGFGTGRCGTASLAKLLNGCKGASVSHEFRERNDPHYRLAWSFIPKEAYRRVNKLRVIKANIVGDIAHYYLNYIPYLIGHLSNLKLIYLHRPKPEVVKSFLRKTYKTHWLPKSHYDCGTHEKWTRTFPQFFEARDRVHSIELYWDSYQRKAKRLKEKYRDKIFYMSLYDLNDKARLKQMYDFLEIPKSDRNYNIMWENKSE